MAIVSKYKSSKPLAPKAGALRRYVRRDAVGDGYSWCVKPERSLYDIEHGTCAADDLPAAVRDAADAQQGHAFGYVDWPLN